MPILVNVNRGGVRRNVNIMVQGSKTALIRQFWVYANEINANQA